MKNTTEVIKEKKMPEEYKPIPHEDNPLKNIVKNILDDENTTQNVIDLDPETQRNNTLPSQDSDKTEKVGT